MALYFGYYARKLLFYCLKKKYIFHTLYVQFNSKGAMQCMIKPHERLLIWMMLVSEDNASRKKKRRKKKLHSALFYLPAGGLLLTHHNGVKVYFNKHTVWETGKLASLATPGVTVLKQSVLPPDTCAVMHRKASSSTLLRAVMPQQGWPWVPTEGNGQAWARCLFGKTLCFQEGAQICAFSFPHINLHFHLCEDSNATGGLGGPPGYKVPLFPGEGPEVRGELRYAMVWGEEVWGPHSLRGRKTKDG